MLDFASMVEKCEFDKLFKAVDNVQSDIEASTDLMYHIYNWDMDFSNRDVNWEAYHKAVKLMECLEQVRDLLLDLDDSDWDNNNPSDIR